jgi:hypothetical protein
MATINLSSDDVKKIIEHYIKNRYTVYIKNIYTVDYFDIPSFVIEFVDSEAIVEVPPCQLPHKK